MDRDPALSAALLVLLIAAAPHPAQRKHKPAPHSKKALHLRPGVHSSLLLPSDWLLLEGRPGITAESSIASLLGGQLLTAPENDDRPPSMLPPANSTQLPPARVWLSYCWTF